MRQPLYRAVLEHGDDESQLEQLEVNFRSPVDLMRRVLPSMRRKMRGKIINISSVGGMMAMPTMGMYSASKFALEGASEALWAEVRPWGVSVSLLQPGFINSSSYRRVKLTQEGQRALGASDEPYHHHYRCMGAFVGKMMRRAASTPVEVAAKILKVMEAKRPPLRVPVTPDAVLFALLRRFLPSRVYHWLIYSTLPQIHRWGEASAAGRAAPPPVIGGATEAQRAPPTSYIRNLKPERVAQKKRHSA